jgi:hypothetical protein
MRHPFVLALAAGVLILLLAFAAPLWRMGRGDAAAPPPAGELPWQVQARADGTLQAFGLTLGRDTLADVQGRLGDALQVAVVARIDEPGALEALADPFDAGFVTGRLVLAFEAPAAELARWRERAPKSEPMEGGVRRFALDAAAREEAARAPLSGISFVPTLKLTEADVRQRFGPPRGEVAQGDGKVLLYPERGLAAHVAEGRRAVLQYVAPAEFERRLRAPLAASAAGG